MDGYCLDLESEDGTGGFSLAALSPNGAKDLPARVSPSPEGSFSLLKLLEPWITKLEFYGKN